MHIVKNFELKRASQLDAGELIWVSEGRRGGRLSIFVGNLVDQGTANFLVLRSNVEGLNAFVIDSIGSDEHVLSYGNEWQIELIIGEHTTSGRPESIRPGYISMSEDATFLHFANPGNANSPPQAMRLSDFKIMRHFSPSADGFDWKIWLSAEDRDRDGVEPLIDFKSSLGKQEA